MAKEIAIGKRAKISQAQQYMLLAVLGAALFLGAAIALNYHFIQEIVYNAGVVSKQDESIVNYSNTIKSIGVCKKPAGSTYTMEELKKCNPNDIEVSEIPGTLRSNIMENMAANENLNSVPKESKSACVNSETGKNFTFEELNKKYTDAENADDRIAATQLIKICSALRIIPDTLPAFKNEEALLASLNKIFNDSNWQPESISPSGEEEMSSIGNNLTEMSVSLAVESDLATTMALLNNIERSIRTFNFKTATIEWAGDQINFHAQATAFYTEKSTVPETTYKQPVEGK